VPGSPDNARAVFFDLDDTLIAYDVGQEHCWRVACSRHAPRHAFPPVDLLVRTMRAQAEWFWSDEDRHRTGRLDMRAARRRIVADALRSMGLPHDAVARAIADDFAAERDKQVAPLQGAIETVQHVRSLHVCVGLITNGESAMQRGKLARFGWQGLFDLVLIEGELGFGKPDTRIFELALERSGTRAEDTWMVGDRPHWDIIPPARMGWRTAWIRRAGAEWPADAGVAPTLTASSVAELSAALTDT
jgi:putative hydrolase of the HAD superfamily